MSTLRVDRVEDREGNPLWDAEQGILGNVTTSTGTQTVAGALDKRAVRFISLKAPLSGTFDPEDYLETSTKVTLGLECFTLSHHAPSDYAVLAEAVPYRGGNSYQIVAASTGTADGGSFIDLSGSGLQAKGSFTSTPDAFQFGAKANGVFNDSPSVQAAVNYADELSMGDASRNFVFETTVNVTSPIKIKSSKATVTLPTAIEAFLITSSLVDVDGLVFEGPDGAVFNTNNVAIRGLGIDNGAAVAPTFITDINITHCEFSGLGRSGVLLRYAKDSTVSHNKVRDTAYAGVEIQSGLNVITNYNTIWDINLVQINNYGIYFSRQNTADLVRDPICRSCTASFNSMRNIDWEGLDCHGGIFLNFTHNVFENCGNNNAAIALIHSDDDVSSPNYGVENSVVAMNIITGSGSYGLAFSAPGGGIVHSNNTVSGNVLFDCGSVSATSDRGGINVGDAVNTSFTGNTFELCAPHGFVIKGAACANVVISANTMKRIVSNALSTSSAILFKRGVSGVGLVSVYGNTLQKGAGGETYDGEFGVRALDTEDGGGFEIGTNSFTAADTPYSVSLSLVDDFTQSPISNYGSLTIPITTAAAFAEAFATLNNPHSGASVAKVIGSLLSSPDKNITVETAITSGSQIRFRVYTADGANFSAAGSVTMSYQTRGY